MSKEFEDYMRRLCDQHDLKSISIHLDVTNDHDYAFYAFVHWKRIADETPCECGSNSATIAEAILSGIHKSHKTRNAIREQMK